MGMVTNRVPKVTVLVKTLKKEGRVKPEGEKQKGGDQNEMDPKT